MPIAPGASELRARVLSELAGAPARKAYAIAYDLLGNRAEAEEAVQDALARACENLHELRDLVAAPGWFLRIVTTGCLRVLRRRRLRRAVFGRWLERVSDDGEATPVEGDGLPADALGARLHAPAPEAADHALGTQQDIAALIARMGDLPSKQRTALVLRYGHDLPVPEIAQMLGVEQATAKTHLVRGLARLRELLEVSP
ncbi:MAG: sigma-70 family RNA polymerase sigma factor [Myxococcales bacterium]|nr:sigma-70 family RNA polymerase sigma factor [Myxococcales bacterium]